MSTELKEQRKLPVGPQGSPTYIGEFHRRYGDDEQLFHSYCRDHSDFGTCGTEDEARMAAEAHLRKSHPSLLAVIPEGSVLVTEEQLSTELLFRLRTVAALALSRGKHGEKLPETFITDEALLAVEYLKLKSEK